VVQSNKVEEAGPKPLLVSRPSHQRTVWLFWSTFRFLAIAVLLSLMISEECKVLIACVRS